MRVVRINPNLRVQGASKMPIGNPGPVVDYESINKKSSPRDYPICLGHFPAAHQDVVKFEQVIDLLNDTS